MAVEIPYVRDLDFEYGKAAHLGPNLRRIIARNPSAFTFTGTGTYILGQEKVAVIDPGPLDSEHVDAIAKETEGQEIVAILITHTHMDHSPGTALLRKFTDAPTYGYGPHGAGKNTDDSVVVEEGGDMNFVPDVTTKQGDVIEVGDLQVECVYTPGHTSNHICYRLKQGRLLFTGDHVMGWSTSVISPPDGDMRDYMASLNLLLDSEDETYWPTHGPAIRDPKTHVTAFIVHRRERERQILEQVKQGRRKITDMVPHMYVGVNKGLYPAAARSVFAAILYMVQEDQVRCEGEPRLESDYYLG